MDSQLPAEIFQVSAGVGVFFIMLTLAREAYQAWKDSMANLHEDNQRLRKENEQLRDIIRRISNGK